MIDINNYPNIASVLRRIAQMQELYRKDYEDDLDRVINAYRPGNEELSESELELATAADKRPELPEYLKNDFRV